MSFSHLYRSSVIRGTLSGEFLCVLCFSLFVFFGNDVVWCVVACITYILCSLGDVRCVVVCYLYISCVLWATFGVYLCLLLNSVFLFFLGGKKKMVQRSYFSFSAAYLQFHQ